MAHSKRDYYEVLGVSRTANADELKQAYRKYALQFHPDRNPGDKSAEEKFKELNEAYAALSDPEKRSAYDQYGHAGVQGAGGGGGGFEGMGEMGDIFSSVFGEMFGGQRGRGRRGARQGADLQTEHVITLADVLAGVQPTLRVTRHVSCARCGGSGAKPGTSVKSCPECRGSGQVRYTRGFFTLAQTCPRCQGQGQVVESPCAECRGQGRTRATETITVRIPAGIDDGVMLRVSGAGEAGERGSTSGDLYVAVRVRPDPRFERDGEHLTTVRRVSFPMASLGGDVEVETLEKPVRIHIPAGTQPGALLRVKNAGLPRLESAGRGDLFVRVVVEIPTKLTKDQRRLLAEMAQTMGETGVDSEEGFFKKAFGG